MVEMILRKRVAQPGEVGLFLDTPVFEEEWASFKLGEEVKADCVSPHNLRYLKFFWALATKVSDNTEFFVDKRDAADGILLQARHYKIIQNPIRDTTELKPRSVAGLSADTWIRLLRRCTHVVITHYLPGMDEGTLKAEIEKMLGMDVFSQKPTKG